MTSRNIAISISAALLFTSLWAGSAFAQGQPFCDSNTNRCDLTTQDPEPRDFKKGNVNGAKIWRDSNGTAMVRFTSRTAEKTMYRVKLCDTQNIAPHKLEDNGSTNRDRQVRVDGGCTVYRLDTYRGIDGFNITPNPNGSFHIYIEAWNPTAKKFVGGRYRVYLGDGVLMPRSGAYYFKI